MFVQTYSWRDARRSCSQTISCLRRRPLLYVHVTQLSMALCWGSAVTVVVSESLNVAYFSACSHTTVPVLGYV